MNWFDQNQSTSLSIKFNQGKVLFDIENPSNTDFEACVLVWSQKYTIQSSSDIEIAPIWSACFQKQILNLKEE